MVIVTPSPQHGQIHPWPADTFTQWRSLSSSATKLERESGVGGDHETLVAEARHLLISEQHARVLAQRLSRRHTLALLDAWDREPELLGSHIPGAFLKEYFHENLPSRIILRHLLQLYLSQFDLLSTDSSDSQFSALCQIIQDGLRSSSTSRTADSFEVLTKHAEYLFTRDGVERLADHLFTNGQDLHAWLEQEGLRIVHGTRYFQVLRMRYYLARIRAAKRYEPLAFKDELTNEFTKRGSTPTSTLDGRYFGHLAIEALAGPYEGIPDKSWLDTIFAIAGDPRTTGTPQWAEWWAFIDDRAREQTEHWIRGLSLQAVLDATEDYAESAEDMKRMFRSRKTFMLGIYNQGLVRDLRLFTATELSRYLRSQRIPGLELKKLEGRGSKTAIIYLECKGFCIIEGSHSFPIHIYITDELPAVKRQKLSYHINEFSQDIPNVFVNSRGEDYHRSFQHKGRVWLYRTLAFLHKNGINVQESLVMDMSDRAEYLARSRNETW